MLVEICVFSGHKDSVTCTGFSYDSKYVSTADMAGTVQVWDVCTGALKWSFECGDLEVSLSFHLHGYPLF